MMIEIDESLALNETGFTLHKDRLVRMCCAIFVDFLLEKEVDVTDSLFGKICMKYDFIFYEINQMYLCDFLPFLKPITARKYLKSISDNSNFLM